MRLGIGSYAYAWAIGAAGREPAEPMTAERLIDRAAELGVGLVQICDNLRWDFDRAEALRDHAAGRDPDAILELWPPPAEDFARTIAREDAWARSSVEFLRQHITD